MEIIFNVLIFSFIAIGGALLIGLMFMHLVELILVVKKDLKRIKKDGE